MNTESSWRAGAIWLVVLTGFAVLNIGRVTLSSVGHDFYQFWSFGQMTARTAPDGLYEKTTFNPRSSDPHHCRLCGKG